MFQFKKESLFINPAKYGGNLGGKAIKLQTNASSGSNINAQELMANEIIATASSGSYTDVFPILSLKAKASSGAHINYHKTPKNITVAESSAGSVSQN